MQKKHTFKIRGSSYLFQSDCNNSFYYLNSFSSLLWVLLFHLHNTDDGGFCWCSLRRAVLPFFFLVKRVLVVTLKCSGVSSLPKAAVPSCGRLVRYRLRCLFRAQKCVCSFRSTDGSGLWFFFSYPGRSVSALLLGTKLVLVSFRSSTVWQNFSPYLK